MHNYVLVGIVVIVLAAFYGGWRRLKAKKRQQQRRSGSSGSREKPWLHEARGDGDSTTPHRERGGDDMGPIVVPVDNTGNIEAGAVLTTGLATLDPEPSKAEGRNEEPPSADFKAGGAVDGFRGGGADATWESHDADAKPRADSEVLATRNDTFAHNDRGDDNNTSQSDPGSGESDGD